MKKSHLILSLFALLLLPTFADAAGPFTLPFLEEHAVNAYMDLDDRIDWVSDYEHPTPWQESIAGWSIGYAYDGHQGTDYALSTGTTVVAAATGTVSSIGDNHVNTYPGGDSHDTGNKIVIDRPDYQTRYYHLETGSLQVSTSTSVGWGDYIANSGNTGYSSGPHLHFEVRSATSSLPVDPYSNNLWKSSPPTLSPVFVSGNITSNQTWNSNGLYILSGNVAVNSGVALIIEPGTIIKFENSSSLLTVNGVLNADGTADRPIYFTSRQDDSIGGDTNNNGPSSGSGGNWRTILTNSGASTTLSHTIIRYGAANNLGSSISVTNDGGKLYIWDSFIGNGVSVGVDNIAGTTTIASSTVSGHDFNVVPHGANVTILNSILENPGTNNIWSGSGILTVASTTFRNNASAAAKINMGTLTFNHWGNTATGTGVGGFVMAGTVNSNRTWGPDGVPYMMGSDPASINSGSTLTISPGVTVQLQSAATFTINGTLNAQGENGNGVVLTSVPGGSRWRTIQLNSGASSTFAYTLIENGANGGSGAMIYNNGGNLNLLNSRVTASASNVGVTNASGTTTLSGTEIDDHWIGLYIAGGNASATSSSFHGNAGTAVNNQTGSMKNFENNYWGATSGPFHSTLNPTGTGNAVTNNVDFSPWLSTWP